MLRFGAARRGASLRCSGLRLRFASLRRKNTVLVSVAKPFVVTCRALTMVSLASAEENALNPAPPSWRREVVALSRRCFDGRVAGGNLCSVCVEARFAESLCAVRNVGFGWYSGETRERAVVERRQRAIRCESSVAVGCSLVASCGREHWRRPRRWRASAPSTRGLVRTT